MSTPVASYVLVSVVAALANDAAYNIKEYQHATSKYHTFQVNLNALKKGATPIGPIERGTLLAAAKTKLEAAGYVVEDRNGYKKGDQFVNWPHLLLIEPGTSYQDTNKAADTRLAAAEARGIAQAAQIAQLIAALGASNPAVAAAVAAVAPATDEVVVEADEVVETPQGETSEESFAEQPSA